MLNHSSGAAWPFSAAVHHIWSYKCCGRSRNAAWRKMLKLSPRRKHLANLRHNKVYTVDHSGISSGVPFQTSNSFGIRNLGTKKTSVCLHGSPGDPHRFWGDLGWHGSSGWRSGMNHQLMQDFLDSIISLNNSEYHYYSLSWLHMFTAFIIEEITMH